MTDNYTTREDNVKVYPPMYAYGYGMNFTDKWEKGFKR